MYIWCAIDLSGQLKELRESTEAVCRQMEIYNPALTLPSHISLKISCEIDDSFFDEAVGRLCKKFQETHSFEIKPDGIERQGGIVWIKHHPSCDLYALHLWLVDFFKEYGFNLFV